MSIRHSAPTLTRVNGSTRVPVAGLYLPSESIVATFVPFSVTVVRVACSRSCVRSGSILPS